MMLAANCLIPSKAGERMTFMRVLFLLAVLAVLMATGAAAAAPVAVTFQINDSYVKDKVIPNAGIGVASAEDGPFVASGTTDVAGRLVLSLEPGDYFVTYKAPGYVPIYKSPVRVGPEPATITTTLTMMMEDTGTGAQTRIQIVLNWGSRTEDQVSDIDAHLLCPCKAESAHTYFGAQTHDGSGHSAALDVDDRDWGGPETITLTDPVAGVHHYWVYDYSGSDSAKLGMSDVVVRVVVNDRVAGEYRIPGDVTERVWRPFKELTLEPPKEPRIVPFSPEDLAAKLDRQLPAEQAWPSPSGRTEGTSPMQSSIWRGLLVGLIIFLAILFLVKRLRRRRLSR
jgi:hypothetical protein